MKLLKRAIVMFLALVLVLNIFSFAPFNESYGNTVYAASTSDGGVPLYQANVIAKGYNNDGDGYYKLFKSFQDPVYYELTDYMLEDNILCWTSNFWNSAFNSEFQKNPSYFYEVMLMGYIKYEQKEINTSGIWDSKEMALATEIYKELADQVIGAVETPNYKQFLNQVKNMSNDELKRVLKNVDCIKLSSDILDDLSKGLDYGTEFIDAVAEYEALFDAKSERIESLKLLRSKVTDNDYFTKAVDDIIEKMEQTPISYVAGKMIDKLWDDFLDTAWNLIIDGSPIATVLKAIDIEKMTLDVLFNSSDTASNNFKLLVLYIVDTYFDSALEQSLKNYNSTSSVSNGVTLIQSYKGYIEYQMYGLDYTKTFISDIVDSGPIHHIIEQIFFKESIQSAEELTRLCDSQISSRQRLLELLEKSADIYYDKTGLNKLVDALNETEEQNVPVTSISFKQSEITLKSTKDICMISADVFPENATNKKVTYTSSDPSILSVPENGGFATQKGEGTVTVTATAEDGGLTATQTVTVKYAPVLTRDYHGKCGSNVYWTLYSDGTMYITGTGAMYSYSPWDSYVDSIKYVIIGDGVTSVSNDAFKGCSLESVVIGDGLKSLNGFSFGKNLKIITIGNSVKNIGMDVFRGCTNLSSVKIGNNVTSIGWYAFYNCTNLKDIIIPDSVTEISEEAFKNCTGLESITIGNSVKKIDSSAFENCESLKSVTIPDSVTSIGNSVFKNCTSLVGVKIGNNVTGIGEYAFYNCKSLKSVTIPDSVTSIEISAFENCTSLVGVKIGNSVTEISEEAFKNCESLKSITIPNSVTRIWWDVFYGCPLESVVIGDGLKSLSGFSFGENLKMITMGRGVTSINDREFKDCTNLTSVKIGDGVTSIGDSAFRNCQSLKNVTIPDSVISIGCAAFFDCINLENIIIGNSVTNIEDSAFENCKKLKDIAIPDSVTSIGGSAFRNCINFKEIIIPDSVTSIGSKAFFDCYLENIVLGDGLENLEGFNFDSHLKAIIIGNSITKIEDYAFENCTSLESITIGNSVKSIGRWAFNGCINLSKTNYSGTIEQWVKIKFGHAGGSVSDLYSNPTYYSKDLYIKNQLVTEINLTTVTEISDSAFKNCESIKSVILSDNVTSIGVQAFAGCINLENITIGSSVTNIDYLAFENCKNLAKTNYAGTIDQWAEIFFGSSPTYYSEDLYINNQLVTEANLSIATKISSDAFWNCKSIKNVTIPESVKSIGLQAFDGCINLIKTNYTGTIDQWAKIGFQGESSNPTYYSKDLYINNQLVTEANLTTTTKISQFAFYYCRSLESITIPHSVTEIENYALKNCFALKDIYYDGSENEWNNFEIHYGNESINNANIHYNTSDNDYVVSERIEPDCEKEGKITYTCPHGFTKTAILSELGHNTIVKEIVQPTCNKGGYTVYECDRCGKTYNSDYTEPLGHNFINGICKNCGKTKDECVESSHPYENDCDEIWTINKPGAKSISVTFSKNTEVEYDCDYIYILDQNGNEVGCYTGDSLASKTITVSGNTVKIRLVSDESSTYYGFSLTSVKANYSEPAKFNDFEYLLLDDGTIEITRYVGSDTKLIIPDKINDKKVTRIGDNTFYNCTNVEAIEIPTTIKSIGYNAFYGCTELEDVYYNGDSDYDLDELIEIDDGNDSLLYDVSIHYYHMEDSSDERPENVKWEIDEKGTLYWSGGNVNEHGGSVEEEIPWYDQREQIKNVVIGDGVGYISNYTFMYCENLEKITIPAGATSVGSLAFWHCDNLKRINVAENNPNYTSVDGVLFNKSKTEIVKYPNAKEGKYTIPNTVRIIGEDAFRESAGLSDIVIPDSVDTIGICAFYDCTRLLNVIIPKSVTKMEGCGLGLLFYKGGDDMIKGFVMKGYAGTAAEAYARDNGLTFEDITNVISNSETTTAPLTKPIVQETTTSATDRSNDNLIQKKATTTKIKKIKRLKKSLKVTWTKVKRVSGYQIQYSTSSKFKKAKKIMIKNAKITSKTIKKLKVKKKYYVRIRTYIIVNGKKKYSSWSKKSQKTK